MYQPHNSLPDTQAQVDHRGIAIDAVGIRGLRYPLTIRESEGSSWSTVGTFDMRVYLSAKQRGTHMSRFVALLQEHSRVLTADGFKALVYSMLQRLCADAGEIILAFPVFFEKAAPVTRVKSLLDCEAEWRGRVDTLGRFTLEYQLTVPATSLCPCSKGISEYGAHNQRSHIRVRATLAAPLLMSNLLVAAEQAASCATYALLKRSDEKFVTESAYDNAKFVEDMVRELAMALKEDPRIRQFVVEIENFESIHNHSAIARIESATAVEAQHSDYQNP